MLKQPLLTDINLNWHSEHLLTTIHYPRSQTKRNRGLTGELFVVSELTEFELFVVQL
ncbi:unnamed protein product [Schistosoma margrebowiei]|uniref:Uncharacterized protein n=1 Tax=Schistosoma margrebowiei TaxID=48269 RepID=A0A3P8C7A9_9TREM|nr:unnamed protein product [Schistosoma margrebowiei]